MNVILADVESIYTNIPYDDIMESVNHVYGFKNLNLVLTLILTLVLINLILNINNFRFCDSCYMEIKSTVMGATIVLLIYQPINGLI